MKFFKIQIKTNFKLSNLSVFMKQVLVKSTKKKGGGDYKNSCLIGFLRGQFVDSKAKTRGTALNILKVLWEPLRCRFKPANLKKKTISFVKKLN